MQLTDYEAKSLIAFEKSENEGKWSQGARKFRDVIKIDNFSFIADND